MKYEGSFKFQSANISEDQVRILKEVAIKELRSAYAVFRGFLSFCRFFIQSVTILFLLNGFLKAETSNSGVYELNLEQIALHAAMGDAESQYLMGKAIYAGIANGDTAEITSWWMKAAKQGHEEAAIQLFDLLRRKTTTTADDYSFIIALLGQIADSGSARANADLSDYYMHGENQNTDLMYYYTERAAGLQHRNSMKNMAYFYSQGAGPFERDMTKAVDLAKSSIELPKQDYEEYSHYRTSVCLGYGHLQDFYSEIFSYIDKDGKHVEDRNFSNEILYQEYLQAGVEFGCFSSMQRLAYSLVSWNQKASTENLKEALLLAERMRLSAFDSYGTQIADEISMQASAMLGDFEQAKQFSQAVAAGPLALFDGNFHASGEDIYGICNHFDIPPSDCKRFLSES